MGSSSRDEPTVEVISFAPPQRVIHFPEGSQIHESAVVGSHFHRSVWSGWRMTSGTESRRRWRSDVGAPLESEFTGTEMWRLQSEHEESSPSALRWSEPALKRELRRKKVLKMHKTIKNKMWSWKSQENRRNKSWKKSYVYSHPQCWVKYS